MSDTEIVLGSHQDLSGPINFFGVPMKNGLEMAADEINAAGGIHGRMIRVVVEDSAYDPKKAVLATQKLLNRDKIFAMIASLGTPTSAASMPLVLKKGLPHLFPMSPADLFFKPYEALKFGYFTPYYDLDALAGVKTPDRAERLHHRSASSIRTMVTARSFALGRRRSARGDGHGAGLGNHLQARRHRLRDPDRQDYAATAPIW